MAAVSGWAVVAVMAAAEVSANSGKRATVDEGELPLYRTATVKLLRRYFRASIELGRLPVPLGKSAGMMRAKCSSHRLSSFENTMILVCDVERCVKQLDVFEQTLVGRIAMQEYTMEEAAGVMRCNEKTVRRRYPEALDKLTAMLLVRGLLERV